MDNPVLLPPTPPITEVPSAPVNGNKNTLIIVLVILLFIIGLGTLVAIKITDQINAPPPVGGLTPSPVVSVTATPTQKITPTIAVSDNQDLDQDFRAIPTLAPLDTTDLDTDLQGL